MDTQSPLVERVTIKRLTTPSKRYNEFNVNGSLSYNLGYCTSLNSNVVKQSGAMTLGLGHKTRQLESTATLGSRAITIIQ